MKKILSKPIIVISLTLVIGIILVISLYNKIGKAPVVDVTLGTPSTTVSSSGVVDLSFPKSGRISEVNVVSGQTVHKGEVLSKLSAPDQEGVVSQAKGALDLAQAQYASLNSQYATTKKQQDLIVSNAYRTMLSSGLAGTPDKQDKNVPIISGTYTCSKEGSYLIEPYASANNDTGYSFKFSGLESGIGDVKYDNSIALGACGLQIKFTSPTITGATFNQNIKWTINIPNTESGTYLANKNAYELAKQNEEKVLADLSTTLGGNGDTSVEKAQISAAQGAYDAALGSYQNNLIIAPTDGVVSFVDKDLKVGQSITPNKIVISITAK